MPAVQVLSMVYTVQTLQTRDSSDTRRFSTTETGPHCPDGYWTTRGYGNSRTGRLADWSTRGLDNLRTGHVADWTTRGCQRRVCVLSYRPFGGICETVSCPVRDLSSPLVD